jgi:6-phosphogluconolactonase
MYASSQTRINKETNEMKNLRVPFRSGLRLLVIAAFALSFLAGFASPAAAAKTPPGAVYTLTNAAAGNAVRVYDRSASGALSFRRAYPTDGLGSGSGLGSQGALILSPNNHWLFAVNAGSNSISVFQVLKRGLLLVDVEPSGGVRPVSLTVWGNFLYALNAGDTGDIAGFGIGRDGNLSPLAGSSQPLSNSGLGAAPGVGEISFSPDGSTLVVTEKTTNLIDTYAVVDGIASGPTTHASSGLTPFGFGFNIHGYAVVSEAFGGQAGASALSSYHVAQDTFELVSPSVATTQTAACWVAISKNGAYAYTTNAGSASISSYAIGEDGSLALLDAVAGATGASPVDMAITNSGRFLYALASGGHAINGFAVQSDGSLVSVGDAGVPVGVAGLAAR